MQIEFFGANCLRLKDGSTSLVFDDNLADLGSRSITTDQDVVCLTNSQLLTGAAGGRLLFDCPGEYEVGGFRLSAYPVPAYGSQSDSDQTAVCYRGQLTGLTFLVLGCTAEQLPEAVMTAIAGIEVVFMPIGGAGSSLNPAQAHQLAAKLSAKLVVPTYYQNPDLKLSPELAEVSDFIKLFDCPVIEAKRSYRLRPRQLTESSQLLVIEA